MFDVYFDVIILFALSVTVCEIITSDISKCIRLNCLTVKKKNDVVKGNAASWIHLKLFCSIYQRYIYAHTSAIYIHTHKSAICTHTHTSAIYIHTHTIAIFDQKKL